MPQLEFQSWTLRSLPSARREVGKWGQFLWGRMGCVNGVITSVSIPCPVLTTIEGIIDRAVAGLEQDQPARRVRGWEGEGAPQGWKTLGISIPCPVVSHRAGGESTETLVYAMVTLLAALGCPYSS